MRENAELLENIINGVLKDKGYRKKKKSWWYDAGECIILIVLERSTWGEQYHLDFGIAVKSLTSSTFPKWQESAIGGPLDMIRDDRSTVQDLLDFDRTGISPEERRQGIVQFLERDAIPFLDSISSYDGIRNAWHKGALKKFAFVLPAKKLLGIAG